MQSSSEASAQRRKYSGRGGEAKPLAPDELARSIAQRIRLRLDGTMVQIACRYPQREFARASL